MIRTGISGLYPIQPCSTEISAFLRSGKVPLSLKETPIRVCKLSFFTQYATPQSMVMSSITVCGSRFTRISSVSETLSTKITIIETKPLKFTWQTIISLTSIVHAIRNILSTDKTLLQRTKPRTTTRSLIIEKVSLVPIRLPLIRSSISTLLAQRTTTRKWSMTKIPVTSLVTMLSIQQEGLREPVSYTPSTGSEKSKVSNTVPTGVNRVRNETTSYVSGSRSLDTSVFEIATLRKTIPVKTIGLSSTSLTRPCPVPWFLPSTKTLVVVGST